MPVIPDNPAITAVLPTFGTDFEQVSRYDGSGLGTHYRGAGQKFDDITSFEYGIGYQVYCKATSPVTVTISGKLPTQPLSQSLAADWHVLPATAVQSVPVSEVFGSLAPSQVLRYDPATSALTSATQAEPGQAYYVQLTSASTWTPPLPRDPITRFVYDGDGGRVKQTTAAGITRYLGEAYEVAPSGTTTKYVFAGSQRIAAKDSTGTLRFYHTDHLGSSNVVTDATGALVELNEHTPYGSLSRHEGTADVRHKFTGQHQDAGTGLILFPARAYDPALGRFLQPDPFVQDPADPQTMNRYAYVRNNPVVFVDPSGYSFLSKLFAAIAAVVVLFATGNPYLAYQTFTYTDAHVQQLQGDSPDTAQTALVLLLQLGIEAAFAQPEDPTGTSKATGQALSQAVGEELHTEHHTEETEVAQAIVRDLGVSAGRAADAIAEALASPQAATVGRSVAGTAASRTIDVLSQYGRPLTGPELAGAAPGGLGLDVGLLKTRALRGFKGAGRPLAIFLTVNEVVNTYQNPLLNLEQQNQRAGVQVRALGFKLGGAALIAGLVGLTGVGAPVAFGIQVVGGGLWSGIMDVVKERELRRKGLSF